MHFVQIIEAKRDGHELTPEQIHQFVEGVVTGTIPDYQISALLMAIYFRGLSKKETQYLTLAMRDSGEKLQLPDDDPRPVVDKHSTGGVGDKISLALTPLLACLGFRVPMISGRSLGITGGTLDKLESIPGFQTNLSPSEIVETVQKVGCVICGQTTRMVPADKKLYALRDVTGTVPSIPLIVASIMSKKLAENPQALILDVKFGADAFMQTLDQAVNLAKALTSIGKACGVRTRALITNMNTPIGQAVGNWLEVKEAFALLTLRTPPTTMHPLYDLWTLVIHCAAHLLLLTGKQKHLRAALHQVIQCLHSDEPLKKWYEMLAAQKADIPAFMKQLEKDHLAPILHEVKSPTTGYVRHCNAKLIGEAIRELGGTRSTTESKIDHFVGIDKLVKPGNRVRAGDTLARIHASDSTKAMKAAALVEKAFAISRTQPRPQPLIARQITG